ncbi:hypothetical protein SMU26_09909 [Streptococcus mutans 3SN1]|nr:hypothetical protein SMU3_06939 [Streptococcus mutans 11A1]EMB63831.1 hypothetical protein SMU26_09909 [Streptococcus mutans 3SN1]EMB65589.1 hypothetical protein SMU29_09319 [Streptococcus mutans 2ST1]EMB67904.1 hypothetical protein SMU33_09726 [Streptococcus mutans 11SSST2]EMB81021.1 hypothetical protein SMU52_06756 [Streptococcus mutans NFSM2]EMB85397.1 hypothetical protein SMU53_01210 [Streptococcus mutans NVAB]EMB86234.1 hypothetical protein SMU54_03522 [Streptococcus mutans A9]EMB999
MKLSENHICLTMWAGRSLIVQLSFYFDVGLKLSDKQDFDIFVFQSD